MSGFGTWLESAFYQDAPRTCSCGASEKVVDKQKYTLNGKLVQCSECVDVTHFSAGSRHRHVGRDVALRYILRFGGSTLAIQTDFDNIEVLLKNTVGVVIATVSMLDTFPKPPAHSDFSEIPY